MPMCSVFGCNERNGHRFPNREKSPTRFAIWTDFCKRKSFHPGQNARICNKHFFESDLDESSVLKKKLMPNSQEPYLKNNAVPSVNVEQYIITTYVQPKFKNIIQIPEFQSAIQIPEMDPNDLPDIPFLMPRSITLPVPAMPQRPDFPRVMPTPRSMFPHPLSMPRPEFSRPLPTPRQEFAHPLLSMPRPEFPSLMTPMIRPELAHAASRVEFHSNGIPTGINFSSPIGTPRLAHHSGMAASMQRVQLPSLMEHIFMASSSSMTVDGNRTADDFHDIAAMMGLDQTDDDDDADTAADSDESIDTDEATEGGPSAAKKMRLQEKSDDAAAGEHKNDNGTDGRDVTDQDRRENDTGFLPDLPQPKALAERGPSDFTAQEHIFLAWAKTMSTFTAKRQATIKMQINKIMSEAEFEDLDDEFFAANTPPRRPIYTSRR